MLTNVKQTVLSYLPYNLGLGGSVATKLSLTDGQQIEPPPTLPFSASDSSDLEVLMSIQGGHIHVFGVSGVELITISVGLLSFIFIALKGILDVYNLIMERKIKKLQLKQLSKKHQEDEAKKEKE